MQDGKLLASVRLTADPEGFTEVLIPPPCLWDCVDCFSENGVDASFTFTPPHFVARVAPASSPRIHEALGNWNVHPPVNAAN